MGYPSNPVVTDIISLSDITDTYATHWAYLGKGGLRSIDTVVNRNLIPAARREFGMEVTVNADGNPANNKIWILANVALGGTNNTLTDNANWILAPGGGTITGSGTINTVAKFVAAQAVGDSLITDDGVIVTVTGAAGLVTQAIKVTTGAGVGKVLTDDGSGTGQAVWTLPAAGSSGIYTPTLFLVGNLDGATCPGAQWLSVGNTVTVSGKITIDPTAAGVVSQLGISLPVATNLTADYQCGGNASAITLTESGGILADATNDRAQLDIYANTTADHTLAFHFTYRLT